MQTSPRQLQGLSDREASRRRAAGQGNDTPLQTSRTYWDILRHNLFTFINGAYFFLSLVLIALSPGERCAGACLCRPAECGH